VTRNKNSAKYSNQSGIKTLKTIESMIELALNKSNN
jgi:hypothetical protein